MVPQSEIEVDVETAQQVLKLVEAIEDQDDVQHVWTNLSLTAELLAAVSED